MPIQHIIPEDVQANGGKVPQILNFSTRGNEWSTSQLIPGQKNPSHHWIRSQVESRAGLEAAAKTKIPAPVKAETQSPSQQSFIQMTGL
jgi:hypothetical protein